MGVSSTSVAVAQRQAKRKQSKAARLIKTHEKQGSTAIAATMGCAEDATTGAAGSSRLVAYGSEESGSDEATDSNKAAEQEAEEESDSEESLPDRPGVSVVRLSDDDKRLRVS